jgi:hypothetical protein
LGLGRKKRRTEDGKRSGRRMGEERKRTKEEKEKMGEGRKKRKSIVYNIII